MWRFIIFLVINFGALGIGSALMGSIPQNSWYENLNKAPWTPPGWVFGAAWFTIMLTFAIFMTRASVSVSGKELNALYLIFAIQFLLNVLWNPVFFRWHQVLPGLIIIVALTLVVAYFLYWGFSRHLAATWFVLPYFIWLMIATSLNAYVLVKN